MDERFKTLDVATLLGLFAETSNTICLCRRELKSIEEKHRHYEKKEEWIKNSEKLVVARYTYEAIFDEIVRRCKND